MHHIPIRAASAAALLATVLAMPATAQVAPPAPSPGVAEAWSAFRHEVGGHWFVRWAGATGTPRSIYGSGIAIDDWRGSSLEEARRHAEAALRRWPALLGLGTSTFTETIGARMGGTWTLTFAQSFAGLPVIGGLADVRIHESGRLCYLGSTAVPIPADFDPKPTLSEAAATAIAWDRLGLVPPAVHQPGTPRRPRLVIWCDHGSARAVEPALSWEVPVSAVQADGSGPIGRYYIDARNGAVRRFVDDKHRCGEAEHRPSPMPLPTTCTVMAWLHTGYSPTTTPTNEPLAGIEVHIAGVGDYVTDANGQFTVDLAAPTSVTVVLDGIHTRRILGSNPMLQSLVLQPGQNAVFQLGSLSSTQDELAHSTTYYWVHRINELMRSLLGNSPELQVADAVQPTVNIQNSCNAYYIGNSINFYHAAGSCNNTASASVVSHEWGHGLDDRYGGISQTDGLSEGWGDICSMYLLDDPVIGQGFYTNGNGIRNGNNTRQYPVSGGVHAQGQTWMGFAWKFRQNLRALYGTPQAIAISNATVLASIAANAGDQPTAVIQAFLADDDDGNLTNGTPHYNELVAACNAHSLPYPPLLDGFLDNPTVLGPTDEQLVPRFVTVDAVPNNGAFTQVRLHYDDGQPHQAMMAPTSIPNRYRGLLPGRHSPQVMTYHFEATHASGLQLRMPPSGEYGYITLADEVIWRENFDTGAVGWTHGATTGSDDWEIAAPVGASGTGWTDPGGAYSGNRCAGTDLTGDGAYSPSSTCWLRSPTIDCSGKTNLWLRMKRWASCENGFADRLQVKCNGLLVWQSYYLIQENGWTTFEVPLPFANNNPATVVEFVLQSDASTELGGWQIDDLEIYSTTGTVALPAELTLLPAQASGSAPLQLHVQTEAARPFLWILGTTPGPTLVAGVPPILVGGNPISFFDLTDGAGSYTHSITAPNITAATGIVWHSQVLTLTSNGEFLTSNPHINLFTR